MGPKGKSCNCLVRLPLNLRAPKSSAPCDGCALLHGKTRHSRTLNTSILTPSPPQTLPQGCKGSDPDCTVVCLSVPCPLPQTALSPMYSLASPLGAARMRTATHLQGVSSHQRSAGFGTPFPPCAHIHSADDAIGDPLSPVGCVPKCPLPPSTASRRTAPLRCQPLSQQPLATNYCQLGMKGGIKLPLPQLTRLCCALH